MRVTTASGGLEVPPPVFVAAGQTGDILLEHGGVDEPTSRGSDTGERPTAAVLPVLDPAADGLVVTTEALCDLRQGHQAVLALLLGQSSQHFAGDCVDELGKQGDERIHGSHHRPSSFSPSERRPPVSKGLGLTEISAGASRSSSAASSSFTV